MNRSICTKTRRSHKARTRSNRKYRWFSQAHWQALGERAASLDLFRRTNSEQLSSTPTIDGKCSEFRWKKGGNVYLQPDLPSKASWRLRSQGIWCSSISISFKLHTCIYSPSPIPSWYTFLAGYQRLHGLPTTAGRQQQRRYTSYNAYSKRAKKNRHYLRIEVNCKTENTLILLFHFFFKFLIEVLLASKSIAKTKNR